MDALDRRILAEIQREFPLVDDPYAELARRAGGEADDVYRRVQGLIEAGVILRITASYDSRALGFRSTLVGASVSAEHLEEVAEILEGYPEVTHCYERTGERNLWFTLVAADAGALGGLVEELARRIPRARDLEEFPATKVYKIDVTFRPVEDVCAS
ncbi:MAG: Lrp/AsnC family transcriptional regulator [Planctomycetota bacterium]